MKGPTVAEARSLEDCIDAIAHLARVGRAGGAGGLRPETALEAIAVLAASLPDVIALRGRARVPDLKSLPAEGIDLEAHLKAVGRGLMQEALDRCDGVQTKAAEILGMSFRSFRYYAEKHGLKSNEKRPGGAPESARPDPCD